MSCRDGNGEGVGSVVRTGNGVEPKQGLDHFLDLLLGGAAVTGHSLFNLKRRVFADCESALS
jgi:hypothetical protein